jgi:hypothetical protein
MREKEVRGLMEAYSQVHAPQELTEEQVWEEVETWVNSLIEEGYDLSDYTWEEMYEAYLEEQGGNSQMRQRIQASAAAARATAQRTSLGVEKGADGRFTTFGTSDKPIGGTRPQIGTGRGSSGDYQKRDAFDRNKAAREQQAKTLADRLNKEQGLNKPKPTPKDKETPVTPTTPKPSATPTPTTAPKPTAPKPAAAPAAKPAGSAMDQWAKANPKLAAAKAERDRTRGTSATTNPLMKDMKSKLSAPKSPSPSTAKTGFDLAKKGVNLAAGVDLFDVVKGYLLDEGYAESEDAAMVIMVNMSEEWRETIIMELTGGKGHPGYKAGSKDHGDLEDHPAAGKKGGVLSPRYGHHLGDMDDEDEDEDDLESTVKQQSRDSRERTRKPLRDKVKAARKKMTKEGIELEDILALSRRMEKVYEAQHARENPEKYERDEKKKKARDKEAMNDPNTGINSPAFQAFMAQQMGGKKKKKD